MNVFKRAIDSIKGLISEKDYKEHRYDSFKEGELLFHRYKSGETFVGIRNYLSSNSIIIPRWVYKVYLYNNSTLGINSCIWDNSNIVSIRKATDSEKYDFFKILNQKGYEWNEKTQEIIVKPKIGELCIFWFLDKKEAIVGILEDLKMTNGETYYKYGKGWWSNCRIFESKEQYLILRKEPFLV